MWEKDQYLESEMLKNSEDWIWHSRGLKVQIRCRGCDKLMIIKTVGGGKPIRFCDRCGKRGGKHRVKMLE